MVTGPGSGRCAYHIHDERRGVASHSAACIATAHPDEEESVSESFVIGGCVSANGCNSPGAPVLSLELGCSPTMTLKRRVEIYIKVIYHGLLDNNNAIIGDEGSRPITFHDYAFRGLNNEFRDYRRRHIDQSCPEIEGKWETFIGDDYCQFGIWGYPDKQINVSENPEGRFPTLFPGES